MTTMTRSQQTNQDIVSLLKARNTLIVVATREEVRVERAIIEAAAAAGYPTALWSCTTGIVEGSGDQQSQQQGTQDPNQALRFIAERPRRCVYVLRDLHRWFDPMVLRRLRDLARDLQDSAKTEARTLILLMPAAEIPAELAGHAIVLDYPLPERAEMSRILDEILEALPEDRIGEALAGADEAAKKVERDRVIDAALGLNAEEATSCFSRSLVVSRRIDPVLVSAEKRRVVQREKLLTWYDPDPRGFGSIGGLDVMKAWLDKRRLALSQRARDYGLPEPRGVLLAGIPGTGKSATAKAVAAAWQLPLLRLDLGALRSKFVGESETNLRRALQIAETVAPCVLWIDELEKALAGSTGPQGDGGVASDALGALLNWMQEHRGLVFVVATANDVSGLPPEMLRRFDERFFLDLPNEPERREIVAAALGQYGRAVEAVKGSVCEMVARATEGFTGAEIAGLVPAALFTAFADGEREITTDDLVVAAGETTPLVKTAAEKVEALRAWAKGRAKMASSPVVAAKARGRDLDMDPAKPPRPKAN